MPSNNDCVITHATQLVRQVIDTTSELSKSVRVYHDLLGQWRIEHPQRRNNGATLLTAPTLSWEDVAKAKATASEAYDALAKAIKVANRSLDGLDIAIANSLVSPVAVEHDLRHTLKRAEVFENLFFVLKGPDESVQETAAVDDLYCRVIQGSYDKLSQIIFGDLADAVTRLECVVESTKGAPKAADGVKQDERLLPTLRKHDMKAWQASLLHGMTQQQIADKLNSKYNTTISQGQVSRMIQRATAHADASGLSDKVTKPAEREKSMDPSRIELGHRTDGRKPRPSDVAKSNE